MDQVHHKIHLIEHKWQYWHDFFDCLFMYEWEFQVMRKDFFSFGLRHPDKYTMKEEHCNCCLTPVKVSPLERFDFNQIILCRNCYTNYKKYIRGK